MNYVGGTIDLQGKDPHAVAGILKSFFRELPEPIISQDINDGITAVLCKHFYLLNM